MRKFIFLFLLLLLVINWGCSDISIRHLREVPSTQGCYGSPLWISDTSFVFTGPISKETSALYLCTTDSQPRLTPLFMLDTINSLILKSNYIPADNKIYVLGHPKPKENNAVGFIQLNDSTYSFHTISVGFYFWCSISPDGQWLLYSEAPGKDDWTAVWKKNLISGATTLFARYRSLMPIFCYWSWDGRKVMLTPVVSYPNGVRFRLKIVDSINPEFIYVDKDIDVLYPCWSPNGNNILYTEFHGSEDTTKRYTSLWNVSLSKRHVSRVVKLSGKIDYSPAFSPDGKKIALVRYSFTTKRDSIWIADIY